ncbi:MAG: hypothetical protein IJQ06_02440 [Paludibacteraceae bacterium]|nr:hypothetical protein [Paludibacteraceae bacterium]
MRKKLFTFFLAIVASIGSLFAESGTCGDNLTWNLTDGVPRRLQPPPQIQPFPH